EPGHQGEDKTESAGTAALGLALFYEKQYFLSIFRLYSLGVDMIIVRDFPRVLISATCPIIPTKVVGHGGRKLRVRSIDYVTRSVIGEKTVDITSDPFELNLTFDTPGYNTIIIGQIIVEDGSGNIYEYYETHIIYIPDSDKYELDDEYEIWYISKAGFAAKVKATYMGMPRDGSCIVIAWKKGKLVVFDGELKTFVGRSALIKLSFTISRTLASMFANNIEDSSVANVIYKVPDLASIVGAVRMLKFFYEDRRFTPVAISVAYDDFYVYIDVTTHVDLASPLDLFGVIKIITGVGAIIAGALLLMGTLGVSLPLSWTLIVSGLSIACGVISIFTSEMREAPTTITQQARNVRIEAESKIDQTRMDLEAYLDQLVSQGKITEDEKNTILAYVDSIIGEAKKAMSELEDMVNKAYSEGYNKARSEMMPWIATAGVAGFAIGVLLSSR
ncbi:MAG: hypothetical protein DRH17_13335, partial [Deltaproteobacteria bacterium]